MIKGVNKKVIEINDMQNIYFEKAVLYVRPEMQDTPYRHLLKEAAFYLDDSELSPGSKHLSKLSRIFVVTALLTAILGIVIIVCSLF